MKPRLEDVLETIQIAVANAIQTGINAGRIVAPPAQCVVGWPTTPELVMILSQGQYQVNIFPLPDGRQTSRYTPVPFPIENPNVTLTATISGGTINFGGSVVTGLNIHTFVGALLRDAHYQTVPMDTLTTVAAGVKNAINALSLAGVSASSSTSSVSITGSPNVICNIGSSGTVMAVEVNRVQRGIQVTAWCPEPFLRYSVIEPIVENIGTTDFPFLKLSDGTPLRIQNSGRDNFNMDQSQSAYSCYEYHLNFEVEYGLIRLLTGAQVESVELITTINNEPSVTYYAGG
jgi:hypothetical protein